MNKLFYLLLIAAGTIVVGSFVIFSVESQHPDSQINSMLDAIWWTVATVTTVGYGDIVPVTDVGKIVAIFFMFFGIGVLAIFLSVLGTQFYKNRFAKEEKEISHAQKLILDRMDDLEKNQEQLQKELKNLVDELKGTPR
ncbi:MAG: ion channel [Nitrosopumilus sp.]|nr:ion channel [Nitrosopumilus sp.]MDH3793659.1 ion channel [Nitrosopumilus sp.]MDH3855270.1 ion channel [Nitrosopumilus sp.]